MSNKNKTEEEKLRFFLEKEGYTELINNHGVNELVRFIEVELLIPLKADLMKRETVMKNLKNALENYL